MTKHPGKELIDNRNNLWAYVNGRARYAGNECSGHEPTLEFFSSLTFRIPRRQLPKLPEGCHWTDYGGVYDARADIHWGVLKTQRDCDVHVAMVEEFNTRPVENRSEVNCNDSREGR